MKLAIKILFVFLVIQMQLIAQGSLFSADDIDIPYEKFVLKNGLTLLVHEDHKAPIAAVNVWYHVGSKNEKPGKSGFAHLFEHLMFNGSENFNNDYFQALERIGATDLNGTTNNDRTNYFQNVPVAALDQVLWLESDRMGYLLGAIDQERLDEQRGVVQNEKRQRENQPYGRQFDLITKAMFPPGHPYSWTVIGEMEDLNAASLEDVQDWFKTYYGPANAVIAIAGDVNPEEVYERVNHYFGAIPSGPTLVRQEINIPEKPSNTRQEYQDRVPETRIVKVWNTPQFGSNEDAYFDLIASILSTGKNSRLYKKLIYEDQSASSANAFQWSKEIASNFIIQVNVKPGQSDAEVEHSVHEILNGFLKDGPTSEELERAKSSYFSSFIKGLERIGGFGGKSDRLASNQCYFGDADHYKKVLKYIEEATLEDLKKTANKWLSKGNHTLICTPFPEYAVEPNYVDRSKLPEVGEAKKSSFPNIERTKLSNGLEIALTRRAGVPTIVIELIVDAGSTTDVNSIPGTASLAMNMIDEGTTNMSSLQINEKLQMLGATLSAFSDLDMSYISMNTLKPTLDASLELFADVIKNPSFPESEFARLKKEQLVGIQREKSQPISMALRVMPQFLYGKDHPYSLPLTGSGFTETVEKLTREDVVNFYQTWFKPNNATIAVVGDVDMATLTNKIESLLGDWKKGRTQKKEIPKVKDITNNVLYLMDRPESQQSVIIAGHVTSPYGKVNEIAREAFNDVLGGEFTSRINMNLREDKHWSYGSGSFLPDAKGQRPYIFFAPVQTDKTKESVMEMVKEITQFIGEKPITSAELEKVKTNRIMQLPGQWETNNAVSNSLNNIIKYDLPDNYYQVYDEGVRQLSLEQVMNTSKKMIRPEKINWFIVGDREKVQAGLEEVGFDEIIIVDADGNTIEKVSKKVIKP